MNLEKDRESMRCLVNEGDVIYNVLFAKSVLIKQACFKLMKQAW